MVTKEGFMKIGILTFWWSNDNYGQLLQCYALQKYLRDMGHDAFLIRYNWTLDLEPNPILYRILSALNPVKLYRFLDNKRREFCVKKEQKSNNRHFDDFRERYIQQSKLLYSSYYELNKNPPEADIYIVGSDQVWNTWYKNRKRFYKQIHAYFLDFGNKNIRRMSYAASWGDAKLPISFVNDVKHLLANFYYVSVREKSGVELCKICGRNDAEWVCDPTLLLSANTYRKLYYNNTIRKPSKKYIVLYMLLNECKFDIQYVYDFAASKNLEVLYITGNGVIDRRKKFFATIPEWLYLLDNSEYVITNSFHCAVFSTIFHKQFGVIKLTGKASSMNSRFESLFEVLGVEARYLINKDFSILDKLYETKEIISSESFLKAVAKS